MESHLTAGIQATKCMELIQHGTESGSMAALADQLVLEYPVMELTKPPAAHLSRTTGRGVESKRVDCTTQRNLPHQHANFEEPPIFGAGTQQHHLDSKPFREMRHRSGVDISGRTHTYLSKQRRPFVPSVVY
ncbi:hypothetical protein KIN20_006542 [Parelaphostrongylus tenuis]|uniref:Uncharacterized protein n=1 Tax=Parelaphostrongylus tenuis TaxID=148309 RepID=A0AAD5QG06_PARTN|nr:hypothetical protein KIN20_006542 [Parelaphostrongylus tenuis]